MTQEGISISLDPIVRVDRSIRPSYPDDWVRNVLEPQLELSGPAEYSLSTIEQLMHPNQQKDIYVSGNVIYFDLREMKALALCLNLQDCFAIQKKGIAIFRNFFAGNAIFFWALVVVHRNEMDICVPYLVDRGGDKAILGWTWLRDRWLPSSTALLFCKKEN